MPDEETRGELVIRFIETYCKIPSGDHLGKPFKLEPFQKRFILEIFDNPYVTRRAYLSMARKNGKTALIAALVIAFLVGPVAVQNTHILSGAQSRDQAGIIFDLALKMIQLSPELGMRIRPVPSRKILIGLSKNVEYKALSKKGNTAFGQSPAVAILDEVGQVEGPRDNFISALTTSQGAYTNALLIAISTQAPSDTDLFSIWLDTQEAAQDPRIISHVYQAPEDCAMDDRKAWAAANPALGIFKAIEDLEHEAKNAIAMPANEPEFRNYSLNQRVQSAAPFVSRSVWLANGEPPTPIKGRKVYLGLDLAAVNDLCALESVDAKDGSVNSTFWLPKQGLIEKARDDHVPWDLYEKQGFLNTTPGPAVEYEYIAEFLRGVFDAADVQAVGFDRYNMKFLRPWLVKAGFSDRELAKFIEFGQGFASMTPALRDLEVRLLGKRLRHGNHPVLEMCAKNAVVTGESGARKFDKDRARGRIDGMVALAMAVGVMPTDDKSKTPALFFV